MLDFLSGAVTLGFLVVALHFASFWHRTRDPLFLSFAGAFALLGLAQALLALANVPAEERSWIYLVRLAAFLLIIVAIGRKNREAR